MTEQKHLAAGLEIKTLDEGGLFEGYASVFGVQDYDGDVITRGAFRRTLEEYKANGRMPKMLWQHDTREICGMWKDMHEDEHGLYVRGQLLMDVQKGREAYSLMKAGALDCMSIGFNISESVPSEARTMGRVIEEVDLWEVSLVTWGANPDAKVTTVKAKQDIRDFERLLRDAGFSRKEAKAVSAQGFKALEGQRDADTDGGDEIDVDLAKRLLETLKSRG